MMNRTLVLGLWPLVSLLSIACGDSADDSSNAAEPPASQGSESPAGAPSPAGAGSEGQPSAQGAANAPQGMADAPQGAAGAQTDDNAAGTPLGNPDGASGVNTPTPQGNADGTPVDNPGEGTMDPPADMPPTTCSAPTPNGSVGNPCYDAPPPALKFTEMASGLKRPVYVTHAPGDSSRLFIIEQAGPIRILKDGALLPTPFIDLSSKTRLASQAQGERGLLGLAFAPDYATSRRFWVNYTDRGGDTVIEGYTANEDGDTADINSAEPLFNTDQPAGNHNGGMVAFGPDGCLYVATGDGGLANDAFSNGQNAATPLGGILRFDVDNPSESAPGNMLEHPHLWNYGLRNPWRFSFDRQTGDLYMGDVGQGEWEEVDVEPRGVGGRNYGWPCEEGFERGPGAGGGCSGDFTPPAAAQPNGNTQNQSVIGGYVYRGSAIQEMDGRYLYADFNSRKIWTFTWKGDGEICDEYELTDQLQTNNLISSFGEDADGELYVVEFDANNGRVLRIDAR